MNSMILGGCIPSPKKQTEPITVEKNPNMMYMLVGSYATPDEEGIKVYNFDEQTGNSQYISGIKGISNPSFLIPSADGKRIYTVGEDAGKSSTANAIKFDKEQKKLTLLNSQPTDGGAPCYITLSPSEKFVLTANYMGGSITVFPLDKDGKLKSETRLISFTGNSLDKERQTQPHLHCIKFTPDHKYLLASDLGTDQIHVFPVSENVTDGVSHSLLNESEEFNIKVESGSGPRHICFHPNQKFAYLINEISGKVIKFLYASNRLKADGIAIFSINQEEGTLTKTGYQLTGIHPRNFIISRNGRYLLVACRDSNSIQVFERDSQTGLLKDTGKTIKTNKPVCLKFTF